MDEPSLWIALVGIVSYFILFKKDRKELRRRAPIHQETKEKMLERHERESILDKARRGFNDTYPTFWLCVSCRYSYWSYRKEQDPTGNHCVEADWLADHKAIAKL